MEDYKEGRTDEAGAEARLETASHPPKGEKPHPTLRKRRRGPRHGATRKTTARKERSREERQPPARKTLEREWQGVKLRRRRYTVRGMT